MSVISRIEIANWLNLDSTREWNPDYRHVVLDLRGQSTAVQAQNGTGKTRMSRAILALLGRDREFTSDARAKMAPRSAPCGSHIRMEVVHPLDSAQAGVFRLGSDLVGERYVLGMYGYGGQGQRVAFYKYDGRLEDCPVATRQGHRVTLISDDAFRRTLKAANGVLVDPSEEEWLLEIGKHFDRGNIRQMIEYQKKGAGDGTSNFLKVKSKHGERYDEAFFYSVLAPELLVGTMGTEALEGERRFEDTILISARKIGAALGESKRRQAELEETRRALDAIERVNVAARDVASSRHAYEDRCRTLAGEAAFLKTVVLERPVPGIPLSKLPQDERTREIAAHLRIQEDVWYLPDWVLGKITGEEPARLNERATRGSQRGVPINRAQVIELPLRTAAVSGSMTLYTAALAVGLIESAPKFAGGWSKDLARQVLGAAFHWAESEADTNFARKRLLEYRREEIEAQQNYDKAEEERRTVEAALERLQSRQRNMSAARHAYDDMARSGLFSDAELRSPARTGAEAEEYLRSAEGKLQAHQRRVAAGEVLYGRWNAFISENGRDADPGSLADEIEASKRTANEGLLQARANQKEVERRRAAVLANVKSEENRQHKITSALASMSDERRLARKFAELFPGEAVAGLLERVKRELKEAGEQKARLEEKIAAAAGPLRQLTAFRAAFPGETAVQVSVRRARRRDEMVQKCSDLEADLADVQRRRSELERAQVAAGSVERGILEIAGTGAVPLHVAISSFDLPIDRRRLAFTHFSGLLFAPVVETVEEADLVATVLFEKNSPAPVLVRSELDAFCREGAIREADGSAYSYILGARTRPVDCLLDPGLVEREKRSLEDAAAKFKTDLAAALQERAALAPGHADTRLVEDARKAEEDRLEEAVVQARRDVADIDAKLPRLEERASEGSIATIRATERYASLGGDERYDALLDEQQEVSHRLQVLTSEMAEAAAALERAEAVVTNAETTFLKAAERASQVTGLRDLSNFVRDNGPAFMQSAPRVEADLGKDHERARDRTKFNFGLAQERVQLAEGEEASLEAEIRKKSGEKGDLTEAIGTFKKSERDARAGLDEWRPRATGLDEVARRLIAQHRLAQEVIADLDVAADTSDTVSDELRRAINSSRRLDEAIAEGEPQFIVGYAEELREDVEALDLKTRSNAIKDAKGALERARKALHAEIRKVLDDQNLRFSSNERERLDQARNEPRHADELFRHLEKQWQGHNRLSQAAHETLEERRGELATTLKNMTIRLQGNFDAMCKAMKWDAEVETGTLDEAGIQIRAIIHSESQTEALLNEIVEMIESDEQHREKEIVAGRSDMVPSQEQHDESLKERIRLRFYRGMFSEPEVRIRHPELRAGESYRLDEKISTGQQNAVMLMLLLKLADFAIERDIRLQVKDARARRRARALAQKVVLIDGLFSNLSNRELIKESLRAMSKVRGNFQLIGLIHHPQYQNDPEIFPNHIVLARMKHGRSGSYVYLVDGKSVAASELGRHEGEIESVSLMVDRAPERKAGNGAVAPEADADVASTLSP